MLLNGLENKKISKYMSYKSVMDTNIKNQVLRLICNRVIFCKLPVRLGKRFVFLLAVSGCCMVNTMAQQVFTLQEALQVAFQNSPDIIQSRLTLKKTAEQLKAQRAGLKSSINLALDPFSYSKSREFDDQTSSYYTDESVKSAGTLEITQPILWTDGTISLNNEFYYQDQSSSATNTNTGFSNSLSLQLDQPLFTYNTTKFNLKSYELEYENASLSYALEELNIENSVTEAFYNVYESQMVLETAKEDFESYKKSYAIIKNKVEGGLTAKEELLQAEIDMLSSKSTMKDDEVTYQSDMDQFKQLLGVDLNSEIQVMADISIDSVDINLQDAINYGLKNRMEIREKEISIEQAKMDLIQTKGETEFEGNLSLSVGLSGDNEKAQDVYSDPTDSKGVALSLTVPILDWGKKKANMRASQAALDMTEYDLKDEKTAIVLAIREAYREINNQLIQIEIARKNIENAKLTYDINLEEYKNGDLTSMDLSLVQTQLTENKNSLTSAIISYKLQLLNMKILCMYDFVKKQSVVPNLKPSLNK